MTYSVNLKWSDERVERLKELWLVKGLSCSQIANELGGGISRNAVIGKIHRLGLSDQQPKPQKSVAPAEAPRAKRRTGPISQNRLKELASPPRLDTKAEDIFEMKRVKLMDLEPHHCRYMIGEPQDMLYCGNDKRIGSQWCPNHHAFLTEVVTGRRRAWRE